MTFLYLILITLLPALSQPAEYELAATIDAPASQHYSDPLGNVYLVQENRIRRFDASGKEVAHYSNAFLGEITSADLSDPMRIMLFYKDFNQLLWLDNFLTELRSPVLLDQLGYEQAELVCSSSHGGFWLYDLLNDQLRYFNVNLTPVHESIILTPLLDKNDRPVSMLEKNKMLYLNVPSRGILVFDRFANYLKTLPVKGAGRFQVTDHDLFCYRDGKLFRYNFELMETVEIKLPEVAAAVHAEIQPGRLYLYTEEAVFIYK